MELFYASPGNIDLDRSSLLIEGDEFHHMANVLRKKSGELIVVTDGNGLRCEATIGSVGKRSLEAEITAHAHVDRPTTGVTVALSMLKAPQRFELFLEKATELGVSSIIPMMTARTLAQPSSDRMQGRLKRWKTILLSAARQSKRLYLPELTEPMALKKVLALSGFDLRLIPWEGSLLPPGVQYAGKKTIFLIGPEGGFSDVEVQSARAAGFSEISLGRTTLRAETAGIFAVAMVRGELLGEEQAAWL
ncbi:MAG: 16S rRNA (uracil(1498)-N(3))-methyltransferase [Chlorobiaceae bacterium]